MVLRLRRLPTEEQLDQLNAEFADICVQGGIEAVGPFPDEKASNDNLDLPRLALEFDLLHHGRLRQLIDALNRV
jgi:hypothetical protein